MPHKDKDHLLDELKKLQKSVTTYQAHLDKAIQAEDEKRAKPKTKPNHAEYALLQKKMGFIEHVDYFLKTALENKKQKKEDAEAVEAFLEMFVLERRGSSIAKQAAFKGQFFSGHTRVQIAELKQRRYGDKIFWRIVDDFFSLLRMMFGLKVGPSTMGVKGAKVAKEIKQFGKFLHQHIQKIVAEEDRVIARGQQGNGRASPGPRY